MSEENLKPILVTINNALRICGLGRTKLYQLISQGVVKTTKIGKRRLVNYNSLELLAESEVTNAKR